MFPAVPWVADPSLYSPQFRDWLGPLGSFGEPGPVGQAAGSGVMIGPGATYGP